MTEPKIRVMGRDDIGLAVDWAAAEGWNPGLHDADCFHAADAGGFLVSELGGEPIGCISAVRYPGGFAFIGFYIVKPEYRGRGYGLSLWNAAMERVAGCNVGLDGVVAQQANYAKSGFGLAHRNVRYELADASKVGAIKRPDGIVPLAEVPFGQLREYDRRMFCDSRESFLRCWIGRPDAYGFAAMADGQLTGYGVVRPCRRGFKVGPLFASSPELARGLLLSLCGEVGVSPVYLDVPQVNGSAVALAEDFGMTQVFETARMYTKGDPGLPLSEIFGITTFELG